MFLLKKIISPFFMPVPAVLVLALLALFFYGGRESGRGSGVGSREGPVVGGQESRVRRRTVVGGQGSVARGGKGDGC